MDTDVVFSYSIYFGTHLGIVIIRRNNSNLPFTFRTVEINYLLLLFLNWISLQDFMFRFSHTPNGLVYAFDGLFGLPQIYWGTCQFSSDFVFKIPVALPNIVNFRNQENAYSGFAFIFRGKFPFLPWINLKPVPWSNCFSYRNMKGSQDAMLRRNTCLLDHIVSGFVKSAAHHKDRFVIMYHYCGSK